MPPQQHFFFWLLSLCSVCQAGCPAAGGHTSAATAQQQRCVGCLSCCWCTLVLTECSQVVIKGAASRHRRGNVGVDMEMTLHPTCRPPLCRQLLLHITAISAPAARTRQQDATYLFHCNSALRLQNKQHPLLTTGGRCWRQAGRPGVWRCSRSRGWLVAALGSLVGGYAQAGWGLQLPGVPLQCMRTFEEVLCGPLRGARY